MSSSKSHFTCMYEGSIIILVLQYPMPINNQKNEWNSTELTKASPDISKFKNKITHWRNSSKSGPIDCHNFLWFVTTWCNRPCVVGRRRKTSKCCSLSLSLNYTMRKRRKIQEKVLNIFKFFLSFWILNIFFLIKSIKTWDRYILNYL